MADERVFRNARFSQNNAIVSLCLFALVYVFPGAMLGRHYAIWAGIAWMTLGAILYLIFAWRCFFPDSLVCDRDGIHIRGKWKRPFSLGYDKIHEARWFEHPAAVRRLFGPLVFAEPAWLMQVHSRRRLLITHSGEPLWIREDEFGDLAALDETLKHHRVPGMGDYSRRIPVLGQNP